MTETITAIFEPDFRQCAITVVTARGGFTYVGLAVKWLKATKEDTVFRVLIPCEKEVGRRLMVVFDWGAAWDYRRSGRL